MRVQPAVNEDEHLSLINPSTAFKLIDFTLSRNWTNTIRVGRRDRGRYRRVDVARTNHIQYPRGIRANGHGEVMGQLTFNLSADDIECRNSDLRLDAINGLLARRYVKHQRDGGWAIRRRGSIDAAE